MKNKNMHLLCRIYAYKLVLLINALLAKRVFLYCAQPLLRMTPSTRMPRLLMMVRQSVVLTRTPKATLFLTPRSVVLDHLLLLGVVETCFLFNNKG